MSEAQAAKGTPPPQAGASVLVPCAACGGEGKHACSQCITTRYCSGECQKSHWSQHKAQCRKAQSLAKMKLAYLKVTTFQDLLDRNLDYLDGKLDFNPYTHAKVSSDPDMQALVPKLKAATALGFYTITGQASKAAYNSFDDNKKVFVSLEQRNYSSGWLEDVQARTLEAWLKTCKYRDDIFYRIDFDNEQGYYVQQNMPYNDKNAFNLSRYYETPTSHAAELPLTKESWNERVNIWNDVLHRRNVFYQFKDFPKCMNLFLKCAGVYIVTRQYNSTVSVEDVMADFLNESKGKAVEVGSA